jgi:heme exporter protein A
MSLSASNLECIREDQPLFSELNFAVNSGELLWVTGVNGAGKSSLLRIMAGLLLPAMGDVRWQQQLIAEMPTYNNDMAYLGHKTGIKLGLTVIENLRLFNAMQSKAPKDDMHNALVQLGLDGLQHRLTQTLSAGQKQRIALARLFLSKAKLWILDEPFTALDVTTIELLESKLKHHINNGGLVVLASHQVSNLASLCAIKMEL